MGLLLPILSLFLLGIVLLALCYLCGIWPFGSHEPWGLHTARFAHERESRHLRSHDAPADGLLLCQDKRRRFLAVRPTEDKRELGSLLVVGPTRCGKGLLATSLLTTYGGSVIVNDIKGELYARTAGYRATLGPVLVIDPTGVGHRFDPIQSRAAEGEDGLYAAAAELLTDPRERDQIFTLRAVGMLSCIFTAASIAGVPALPYTRLRIRAGLAATAQQLHFADPELATAFLDAPLEQANFGDRFLASAWGTLVARLRPLLTETMVRTLAGSDFQPAHLMLSRRPVSVYIRLNERDLVALGPLVRLVWDTLLGELITTYDSRGGRGCSPVLLLVDEAGRTAIPSLAKHSTTVVGRGINIVAMVQSLSQLTDVYGKEAGQVLRDNCESQLFYPPRDLGTADYLQHRLGVVSGFAQSETIRGGEQTAEGHSEQAVPLLTAQQIMQMPDGEVLLFHRNLPPVRGRRVDWREHEDLALRHNLPAPTVPPLPPLPRISLLPLPGLDEYDMSGFIA
jgi:type IV secretion system protein VirD4